MTERLPPLGYYKWHWQTWRANRKVQRMNYIERGLYRDLLDECWSEGFIPDDIEKLADICGCPADVMANAWQVLSKCFANASTGFLINERLEQERTEIDKTRVNRARAGAAGGKAKSSNGAALDSTSQANASKCQANASGSHIEEKSLEESRREEKRIRAPKFGIRQMLDTCPGLTEQEALDYQAVRKAKRVGNVSETAWRAIEKEANRAGVRFDEAVRKCISRGWAGFEAKWLDSPTTQGKPAGVIDFRAKRKAEEDAIWDEYMKPDQAPQRGDYIEGEFTSEQ